MSEISPKTPDDFLSALRTTLWVDRYDLLEEDALPKAKELLIGYARVGGDMNKLFPHSNPPTPVWLSWILANEAEFLKLSWMLANEPELLKDFHDESDEARRQRQQAALNFVKELGAKLVYKRFPGGSTALSTALKHEGRITIELLMEAGFDFSLEKKPPLLQMLARRGIARPDFRDKEGEALLALLLKGGAQPNQGSDDGVYYPLTMACSRSEPGFVALLLQYGANPNVVDKYGATPIMHCIENVLSGRQETYGRRNEAEIVELLLRAGAHVHARTTQNRTFHSMVERSCNTELKATLFALVEQHFGKAGDKPVQAIKAAAPKAPQLLTEEQILSIKDIPGLTKQDAVELILGCYRKNGVQNFAAGSVSQAYNLLKIDRDGEGFITKCSIAEAQKMLTKMTKVKRFGLLAEEEQFKLL